MRERRRLISSLRMAGLWAGLCWVTAQPMFAQRRLAFEHERDIDTAAWTYFPRWQGSQLVGFQDKQARAMLLFAVDREGRREEIPFAIEDASWIYVDGVGAGADGAIVLAGGYQRPGSRHNSFVAWIAPDRKRRTVIEAWPYVPNEVTVAADGTIWTAGHLMDETKIGIATPNVIRRFDTAGKMLGSVTVRARGRETGKDATLTSHLMASRDRVGWFTNGCEYIEFSLDGAELNRFDGPAGLAGDWRGGIGLSADNDLVVGRYGDETLRLWSFDRQARAWVPASLPEDMARGNAILGFDGTTLVTETARKGRLRRFKLIEAVGVKP